MNPPLRSSSDREALIEGLLDGTLDMIATDHAPHTIEEKNGSMIQAPFGITGSETAFSLLYTHFVEKNIFTLAQLVEWLTIRPAKVFGLSAGTMEIGQKADLALFDLQTEKELLAEEYQSKAVNTPFTGWKVKGQTFMTIVDGKIVYNGNG